jgi:hypothetical protein
MLSTLAIATLALGLSYIPQAQGKSGKAANLLDGLTPLVIQLEKAIGDLLQGPPGLKPNAPFLLHKSLNENHPRMKRAWKGLKRFGIQKTGWIGFEFELYIQKNKKKVQRIKTILMYTKHGWRIAEARTYETSYFGGKPLKQYTGMSAPLGKTAIPLLTALTGKQCAYLPYIQRSDIPSNFPPKMKRSLERELKRSTSRVKKTCSALETLKWKPADVKLKIDDIFSFVIDKQGIVTGGLKMEWRLQPKGDLMIGRPNFRGFR